jgi:hypothetical protein
MEKASLHCTTVHSKKYTEVSKTDFYDFNHPKNLHDLNIRSQSYENSENLDVGVI